MTDQELPGTLPEGNVVERELLIPAAADEVWNIVTSDGWLADEVALQLIPAGDAHFTTAGSHRAGWVEEAWPPDGSGQPGRLVFWWENGDEPDSRVELVLDPLERAITRLRISETRPLEVLDLRSIPLSRPGGGYGPTLVAVA